MNKKINEIVTLLKKSWDTMDAKSLRITQDLIKGLDLESIDKSQGVTSEGIELYRDKEQGFILIAYRETQDTYRIPHNHGNGWVIYSVLEGEVEMGNYFNWQKTADRSQLILKDKVILKKGDVQIYYPGDIHDTKCLSENALIIRLTSCDLSVEEAAGRMKRFEVKKSCSL
ncbi:MAG: hypothetical protein COW00_15185 [Bdellovibrio sp. CG12_big_fil_rev_8_21_14_0_65_39_13]|nr:MAG: hypothetical protein COW78_14175 [Bdellovibrio sp. CG22_combo_CG10-13_8_21_14_all_39_27]PIQ58539.1 MAG: hypothetical protein COW00_15185 [Bdellovibrio sp. CG12_big_fil_rev_8_21_14_0_65_39_13]PIR34152.1 MAG: hypothetical protein COV37_13660 [Bdellovibrio sp. CG11_big_fil_rev_8_21_14_0_20_39_38]